MTSTVNRPVAVERRTRVRVIVVAMAILLGMVTYLDRSCMGSLTEPMIKDLKLSPGQTLFGWHLGDEQQQFSYALSAFALAYGGCGIFTAWWGDRVGTRFMLTVVVVGWSFFTMATGAAHGLVSLVVIRFCFGVAESGAWPAITRTLSRWIPYSERGTAQGIVWIGAHITVGLTPMLIHALLSLQDSTGAPLLTWRAIFVLFGSVGSLWAAAWYWWFRDEPSQHAGVNQAELAHIMAGRTFVVTENRLRGWAFWKRLLTNRNVVALCLMYLPNSVIFYFCITWFHTYLAEWHRMKGLALAFFTGLPLLMCVVADLLGGPATDWAVRRVGRRWGRTGVGLISYLVAGGTLLLAAFTHSPWLAATLFALGNAANMFIMGAAWGTCQDIGGGHAGVVSATMNTAGQISVMIWTLLVIPLKNLYGWNADLKLIAASFLLAALCWFFIDPTDSLEPTAVGLID
jgi:MFS transporter, ACS family, glucarate transporter